MLELKNPHSVLAALETRAGDVIEVRFGDRSPRGAWQEVSDLAKSVGVPVRTGRMGGAAAGRGRRDKGETRTDREGELLRRRPAFANGPTSVLINCCPLPEGIGTGSGWHWIVCRILTTSERSSARPHFSASGACC